jgi:hypothetical protein
VAADITPIELGLTDGNVVTLWAPRWREDGEEWEAFLGHEEDLYVFPDAAQLAAFIRTNTEHDLIDHPEWENAAGALADELVPDEDHQFDIVGVPDLVAEPADTWTLAELADTVAILRSLAEVCDLPAIDDVLDSSAGFGLLQRGEVAFLGRAGVKLWDEIGAVVASRWDEVVDALDGIITTPAVDEAALLTAQEELAAVAALVADDTDESDEERDEGERDPDLAFWDDIGVDCVQVTVDGRTGWTLRCYLGDDPVFLSKVNRIQIFSSPAKLETYLADATVDHKMVKLSVWPEIREAVDAGEAAVMAGHENTYTLDDLVEDMKTGPGAVNRHRLDLAVELLTDAAAARGDEEAVEALSTATPLGNLVSAIVKPNPDRLPPAPPFEDEADSLSVLIDRFRANLDWDGRTED